MKNEEKMAIITLLEQIKEKHARTLNHDERTALLVAMECVQNQGKPEWIPCEDQTPENDNEDRVVITSGGNTSIVTNYYNGFNCLDHSRAYEIKNVKAWFYLPESFGEYEGDEEGESEDINHLPTYSFPNSAENKREWIPTIERLPEIGDTVLCSVKTPECTQHHIIICKYCAEEFWKDGTIRAWQPLPEPYKAESEGE